MNNAIKIVMAKHEENLIRLHELVGKKVSVDFQSGSGLEFQITGFLCCGIVVNEYSVKPSMEGLENVSFREDNVVDVFDNAIQVTA